MKKIKILVTGAGSGVGQSIIKALNISKIKCQVISADIDYFNSALFRTKNSIIVPKVEEPGALKWYLTNLKKLKINILMIGSEFDINFFSKNKKIIKKKTNCNICITNSNTIKIADDKYLTQNFLKDNGLPYLKTFKPKTLLEAVKFSKKLKLPFILKSRFGTSSRNVYLIKKKDDLVSFFYHVKKPILQEHIGSRKNDLKTEYTCSFFTTKNKEIIGPFIAKRKLVNGTSWIVEVKNNNKIASLIKKIAKLIDNIGSFNIQLRVNNNGSPIPFEFNPRFSGTTSIRAHFGFNEPEMYIRNFILGKKINQPIIKKGISFRYIEEIFLDNSSLRDVPKRMGKGKIIKWF